MLPSSGSYITPPSSSDLAVLILSPHPRDASCDAFVRRNRRKKIVKRKNASEEGREPHFLAKGKKVEGNTRGVAPPLPPSLPPLPLPAAGQTKTDSANDSDTSDTLLPRSPTTAVAGRDSTGRIQESRGDEHPAGEVWVDLDGHEGLGAVLRPTLSSRRISGGRSTVRGGPCVSAARRCTRWFSLAEDSRKFVCGG